MEVPARALVNSFRKPNQSTEVNMLLQQALQDVEIARLLWQKMQEIGNGDEVHDFILVCRLAHVATFGSALDDACFVTDYTNWKQTGNPPPYVKKWIVR